MLHEDGSEREGVEPDSSGGGDGHRPVLVLPITYGLSVRYLVPTGILQALQASVDVVAAISWDDDALTEQLRGIVARVERLPQAELSHELRMYRQRLMVLHERRLNSPTTRIRRFRWNGRRSVRRRMLYEARHLRNWAAVRAPGGAERIERLEADQFRRGSNQADFEELLRAVDADAVLSVIPYHDHDTLLLRAATSLGLPTVSAVISFDNPTSRGHLPVFSDRTLVWSQHNADQLTRSHPGLRAESVRVIGAPQFDLHRRPDLILDETTWRDLLDLPPDRPIILYGSGPSSLVPNEPELVRLIDQAIDEAAIPGRPFLLVRRHPVDPAATWAAASSEIRHGRVVDPWAPGSDPMRSWPTIDDLMIQMSSLAHAVVHVNVCSSMTIDGAMFDRPQIGPTFVPRVGRRAGRVVRDFYRQEHWEPIRRSGGLVTADTPDELIAAIRSALADPARDREARRALCEGVLTWPDGRSSARFVQEVADALGVAHPAGATHRP